MEGSQKPWKMETTGGRYRMDWPDGKRLAIGDEGKYSIGCGAGRAVQSAEGQVAYSIGCGTSKAVQSAESITRFNVSEESGH